MNSFTKYFSLVALSGMVLLSSCRKDEDAPEPTPTQQPGTLSLHLHHKVGSANFALNTNFTDGFGTVFYFTRAEFYVSNFGAYDHDDSLVYAPNSYYVVRPTTTEIALGAPGVSHIHELGFYVGVDSATNHTDPTTYDASSALYPQSPSMHWSWSSGYIFIAIEGVADRNADGTPEAAFQLHIGMDNLRRMVTLPVHTDILNDTENMAHIEIDYLRFLDGVNLSLTTSQTHTMDNMMLATSIANNVDSVFVVE
jgi:hypothetical protein